MCGLSNGTAARLRESTRQSTLNRIANSCDLNIEWLLTGEGEMLRAQPPGQQASGARIMQIAHSPNSGNNSNNTSTEALCKALDEIAAQRRVVEQTQELLRQAQATNSELTAQLLAMLNKK